MPPITLRSVVTVSMSIAFYRVRDLVRRRLRVGDLEVDDRVDVDDEVVLRDHRLRFERRRTCSRRSSSGLTRSTNGTTIVRPGRERPRVAAEPLDDPGPRLRDHPHRLRQGDEHQQRRARRARSARSRDDLLSGHEGGGALDLDDVDGRAFGEAPRRRGTVRAVHSSPPIRTRPPSASTARVTSALRPTSASMPVRESAGRRRCRRAMGRKRASDASPSRR